jgi:hypothetical protein
MLRQIEVLTDFGTVIISEGEVSGLSISVKTETKDNFKDIHINCIDAGIPGIIGPDVDFCLGHVLEQIVENEKCKLKQYRSDDDISIR